MALIGYARVSTNDQNLDLQLHALQEAGVEKIFSDQGVSGTLASRPQLDRAMEYVRDGDVFVVWKLDRLGRSTRNVLEFLDVLKVKNVAFRSLTEGLDTTGPMGQAMITVMSAFAQLERDTLVERTKAGLAVARAKGRVGGRPRALTAAKVKTAQSLYDGGNHTVREIALTLNVGEATVYRYLAAEKAKRVPEPAREDTQA